MASLRTYNNRRRRTSWSQPRLSKWTIEDTARVAKFARDYSMGSRSMKDYIEQLQKVDEAGQGALASFAAYSPTIRRLYTEMEARLKGEQINDRT